MMPYGWNDGGWGIFWMILSMSAMITLIWVAVRTLSSSGDEEEPARRSTELLADRYARGEIDVDEYHERLAVLDTTRSSVAKR